MGDVSSLSAGRNSKKRKRSLSMQAVPARGSACIGMATVPVTAAIPLHRMAMFLLSLLFVQNLPPDKGNDPEYPLKCVRFAFLYAAKGDSYDRKPKLKPAGTGSESESVPKSQQESSLPREQRNERCGSKMSARSFCAFVKNKVWTCAKKCIKSKAAFMRIMRKPLAGWYDCRPVRGVFCHDR